MDMIICLEPKIHAQYLEYVMTIMIRDTPTLLYYRGSLGCSGNRIPSWPNVGDLL